MGVLLLTAIGGSVIIQTFLQAETAGAGDQFWIIVLLTVLNLCTVTALFYTLFKRTLEKNNLSNNILWLKDEEQTLDFLKGRGKYEERNVKSKPNVIFLDLKLPKMNGFEVIREIRESEHSNNIPVVMMTSSQEQKDRLKGYEHGVNSYVVKPLDFHEFTKAINDAGYYWLVLNKPPLDG